VSPPSEALAATETSHWAAAAAAAAVAESAAPAKAAAAAAPAADVTELAGAAAHARSSYAPIVGCHALSPATASCTSAKASHRSARVASSPPPACR